MTDKDVIKKLKDAYPISASEKETAFIKKYELRSRNLPDILLNELRYIGIKSLLPFATLTVFFHEIAKMGDLQLAWYYASLLPIVALIMTTGVGRSEHYGMSELEAASRFSSRLIRLMRLLYLGIGSLALIGVASFVIGRVADGGGAMVFAIVALPYLTNVWGCLMLIRRWHSKDNIYGCAAVTIFTCLIPSAMKGMLAGRLLPTAHALLVLLLIFMLAVREGVLFVRESEELSWN